MRPDRHAFSSNPAHQLANHRHPYDSREPSVGNKRNYRPLLSDSGIARSRSISIEMPPQKTDLFRPKVFQPREPAAGTPEELPVEQKQIGFAGGLDADRHSSHAYPFITKIESRPQPQPDRQAPESIAAENRAAWERQRKELRRLAREKDLVIEELTARGERLARQLGEAKAEAARNALLAETDKRIFDEEARKSAELLASNSRTLRELRAKLDAAEAEKKSLEDRAAQSGQQADRLQSAVGELGARLASAAELEQAARAESAQARERLQQAAENQDRLREHSGAQIDGLQGLNLALDAELRTLKQHAARQASLISSLEAEIARLADDNRALNKRLLAAHSSLEKTTVAEEEFSHAQRENLSRIEELEKKLEDFTEEAGSLEKRRADAEDRLRKTESKLQACTTQLAAAQALQSQLKSELLLKQKENEELNQFVYRLESELRETAETVSGFEAELQEKVRDIEQRERKTGGAAELVRQLEEERDSLAQKYDILLEEVAAFKAAAQEFELKNGYLEDTIKRLEADLAQRDQKVQRHYQIGAVERAAFEERQVSETLEKKLEQAIGTMAVTDGSKKLRILKASMDEKEKELVQLAAFCKSLQSEVLNLRPLSRTNKQLQQQVADLQAENESMVGMLQSMQAEVRAFAKKGDQQRETEMYARDRLATEKRRVEDLARTHGDDVEKLALQNVALLMKLALAYAEVDRLSARDRPK